MMNGSTAKKIRRGIDEREREIADNMLDYFNSLPFRERVKIAVRILQRKL